MPRYLWDVRNQQKIPLSYRSSSLHHHVNSMYDRLSLAFIQLDLLLLTLVRFLAVKSNRDLVIRAVFF